MAALNYIQSEARSYRGDPSNVTLLGHGSGACDVGLHLLSELSGRRPPLPLFNQAILMDGSDLMCAAAASESCCSLSLIDHLELRTLTVRVNVYRVSPRRRAGTTASTRCPGRRARTHSSSPTARAARTATTNAFCAACARTARGTRSPALRLKFPTECDACLHCASLAAFRTPLLRNTIVRTRTSSYYTRTCTAYLYEAPVAVKLSNVLYALVQCTQ